MKINFNTSIYSVITNMYGIMNKEKPFSEAQLKYFVEKCKNDKDLSFTIVNALFNYHADSFFAIIEDEIDKIKL